MMKGNKRFMALVLVLALVFSLAGCGTKEEKGKETESSTKQETVSKGDAEAVKEEKEEKDLSWLGSSRNLPIVEEGTEKTISIYALMDVNTTDPENSWMYKFIEEIMNINIEITKFTNENKAEFLSTTFASGELPDLIIGGGFTSEELVKYGAEEGMLMDLAPYINETYMPNLSSIYAEHPEYKTAVQDSTGAVWSLGFIMDPSNYEMVEKALYNYDLLEANGLDVPETLDEFLEAMRAIKKANPDSYPVGGSYAANNPQEFIMNAFGYINSDRDGKGSTAEICLRDGEVVLAGADKEVYGEYLKFMNTLYKEELIHPDFFTMDSETTKAVAAEGKNAFTTQAPMVFTDDYIAWWGALPLTSAYNDTARWPMGMKSGLSCGGVVVSAETEEIELIMSFLDWFYTFAGYRMSHAGCYMNMYPEWALGFDGWTFSVEEGVKYPGYEKNKDKYQSHGEYRIKEVMLWNGGNFGYYNHDGSVGEVDHNQYWHPSAELYANVDGDDTLHDYDAVRYSEENLVNPQSNGNAHVFIATKSTVCLYTTSDIYPDKVYMDSDVNEEALELRTALEEYIEAESAKFITGARSLDELDDYFATLDGLGAEEYVQLYADYYASLQ